MSRDWSNFQTPFKYQRGWFGSFRTCLPSFMGGIDSAHYDYATRVWDYAETQKRESKRKSFNFADFTTLLNIEPFLQKGTALYNIKHKFITSLFQTADFQKDELCATTLAEHWQLFTTHFDKKIQDTVQQTGIVFRLQFAKTRQTQHPGFLETFYGISLLNDDELRKSFLSHTVNYTNEDLDFIFSNVSQINTLLSDKFLAELIDKNHDLAKALAERYSKTITQETANYALISRLHYKIKETLDLSTVQRIISFFWPGSRLHCPHPQTTTQSADQIHQDLAAHENVLLNFNVLHHFIDRVIALNNAFPSEAELKLFNDYRIAHQPNDPYYYLIAKGFKLTTEKEDKSFECDWLSFDLKKGYRGNELTPVLKESMLKTLKNQIRAIITDKFKQGQYKLDEEKPPIKTRTCDKFGAGFKRHIEKDAKANGIRLFTQALTMSKDNKSFWKIASLTQDHPLIKDLDVLHTAAILLEGQDIVSYKSQIAHEAHRNRFLAPSPQLAIARFKQQINSGKKIHEHQIDKVSTGPNGEMNYQVRHQIVEAIKHAGGEILCGKKRQYAADTIKFVNQY